VGLAKWWQDRERAAPIEPPESNESSAPPQHGEYGPALAIARSPAVDTTWIERATLETAPAGAFDRVHDVERALEHVLVRELRRHGIVAEDT
jgi:hypothetical protein